jgi:hypothetical protein
LLIHGRDDDRGRETVQEIRAGTGNDGRIEPISPLQRGDHLCGLDPRGGHQ